MDCMYHTMTHYHTYDLIHNKCDIIRTSVIFIRMSTQRLFINWINLLAFFLSTIVSFVWTAIKSHLSSIIRTYWTIISLQNLQRLSFTAATFLSICYVIQSKKVFQTKSVRQDVVHRRLNIGPNTIRIDLAIGSIRDRNFTLYFCQFCVHSLSFDIIGILRCEAFLLLLRLPINCYSIISYSTTCSSNFLLVRN